MAKGGGGGGMGGGIMGSGIFGFFGTTIQCPASDTSFYCSFMKLFNLFIVFFIVVVVIWTIYNFWVNTRPTKKRR